MRTRAGRPRHGRRLLALACALMLAATAGCTYSKTEPGLFRSAHDTTSRDERRQPEPTNPALPVVAEALWTTGEGLRVTSRFAVHAVRRMAGATVLDWSVTPLSAPGFRTGDDLPTWVDLGLTRESGGDVNIFLLDPGRQQVYHPLRHRSRREFGRCLCSPLWVAQMSLRLGETRLLQVSYPELPPALSFVDVDIAVVPVVHHVPVTPLGQVPTAVAPTDLARPAEPRQPLSAPYNFSHRDHRGAPVQSIQIMSITAGDGLTSLEWTLRSLTSQPSFSLLPFGPPISGPLPPDALVARPGVASGPQLRVAGDGPVLKARWMTTRFSGVPLFECVCTDIGLWASSLREAGSSVTLVTNFPALPPGTRTVDVLLPGAGVAHGMPVADPPDPAVRSGAAVTDGGGEWVYDSTSPPRGWSTQDWPTPLPATEQLPRFLTTVEPLQDPAGW